MTEGAQMASEAHGGLADVSDGGTGAKVSLSPILHEVSVPRTPRQPYKILRKFQNVGLGRWAHAWERMAAREVGQRGRCNTLQMGPRWLGGCPGTPSWHPLSRGELP